MGRPRLYKGLLDKLLKDPTVVTEIKKDPAAMEALRRQVIDRGPLLMDRRIEPPEMSDWRKLGYQRKCINETYKLVEGLLENLEDRYWYCSRCNRHVESAPDPDGDYDYPEGWGESPEPGPGIYDVLCSDCLKEQ
jgi:hypothetical protein